MVFKEGEFYKNREGGLTYIVGISAGMSHYPITAVNQSGLLTYTKDGQFYVEHKDQWDLLPERVTSNTRRKTRLFNMLDASSSVTFRGALELLPIIAKFSK